MQRALELAKSGLGTVSPNPMVGCVIVHDGKIIGEGYHEMYGGPHAEVNAINSVQDQQLLSNSTAFVTLEPCAHFGKTPPCADLLIEKKIGRVVIACEDPFAKVDGKGIEKLKTAGIAVVVGLGAELATHLNKRFLTFHQYQRPYIILKWAQTADGFLARTNGDSKWISNPHSRQLVHKWRTEEDAILVGKNTAIKDNPALTSRDWIGENPIRILLDSQLEVPENHSLFDRSSKTIILNSLKNESVDENEWIKLENLSPQSILSKLHEMSIQSVIVEGGEKVLNSFIHDDCWDEARIFVSNHKFEEGVDAPSISGTIVSEESIFDDQLKIVENQ